MLVILSDLHFVDGSAGAHNVGVAAYRKVLNGLDVLDRFRTNPQQIAEVQLLFLGDIFDVYRSRNWFKNVGGQPDALRPWGTHEQILPHTDATILAKTDAILEAILRDPVVAEVCAYLCDWKQRMQDKGVPVHYHFIPGNHDRYLHIHPAARAKVRKALQLDDDPADGFPLYHTAEPYRVVAFHGHETDMFNFGRGAWETDPFARDAYGTPSLGEAITIDIASRIPHLAQEYLGKSDAFSDAQKTEITHTLESIDNIRPVEAVFSWLDQLGAASGDALATLLDTVIRKVFDDFATSTFVRKWSDRIDQRYLPPGTSGLKRILAHVADLDLHEAAGWINSTKSARRFLSAALGERGDSASHGAAIQQHKFYRLLRHAFEQMGDGRRRYLVYGHTHVPEVCPLQVDERTESVIFNTGTFRPRLFAARNGGFATHKTLSYAVFYREDEPGGKAGGEKYEFWEAQLATV